MRPRDHETTHHVLLPAAQAGSDKSATLRAVDKRFEQVDKRFDEMSAQMRSLAQGIRVEIRNYADQQRAMLERLDRFEVRNDREHRLMQTPIANSTRNFNPVGAAGAVNTNPAQSRARVPSSESMAL